MKGCPISARFWQMWDSTDLNRRLCRVERIMDLGIRCSREVAGLAQWNPTSAKIGQIWGTLHLFTVRDLAMAIYRLCEIFEKFRLVDDPVQQCTIFSEVRPRVAFLESTTSRDSSTMRA